MSNQIVISSGAKVRNLDGVLTGTSGIVSSVPLGAANGVATLDSGGKVPVSQLPSSVVTYLGTWNAATNTPTLINGTGDAGDMYICNVAGTVNFGAGPVTFAVGDWVLYGSGTWQKSNGQNGTVTSVAVTESGDALTITGSPITTSGTINIGFAGTSGQYVNGAGGLTTFPTLISSIGLSMPSAFNVANSPLTANGTIAVTGAGVASQYIRGDGTLANFPTSGGGGSSVSYYLNGSINQGTIGGVTYYEMNKVPVIGAGTDFSIGSNGYIASFLTDANDPALLEIPAGNWNFETYFNASSGGGSPTFYIELYKYDGTTFTLIASNSAFPKLINDGTSIEAYFSALAVPQTSLTLTDRLAVRIYVTTAGRTITLHTENSHLCQVITTFSTGLTALNGLTAQVQYFGTGTSGTDFNIASSVATHTFNLPVASATNTGKLSASDWSVFNSKEPAITAGTTAQYYRGDKTFQTLNTTAVVEATNLYFTDARSRSALSFASGSGAYNSTTGVITIPTNTNQLTNGASFITLASLSAGTGITYNNTTGVITNSAPDQTVSLTQGAGISISGTYPSFTIASTITQYTDALARAALSFTAGSGAYNSTTGVITIPTNNNQITNGSNFITLTSLSAGAGINYNNTTGAISSTITQYTDALARAAISLTTTGTSGAATYNSTTGVLNIPQYTDQYVGTVTSVGLSSSTSGVTIGSTPITTSGTITLAIATASGSQNGLLSSTDWTTFNNKYNLPSLTSGSVLFSNGSTIAQDNANFFWDDTNNRLGIGTATPLYTLDVVKTGSNGIRVLNNDSGSEAAFVIVQNLTTAGLFGVNNAGPYLYTASALDMQFYTSAIERMRIFSDGNILIGNAATNAGYKLDVSGTGRFTGALTGTSAEFSSSVTAGGDIYIPNGNYYYAKRNTGGANINVLGIASGTDTLTIKGGTSGATNSINFEDTGGLIATFYNGRLGIGTSSPSATLVVGTQSTGTSGSSFAADNSIVARVGASYSANKVVGLTIANTAAAAVNNEAALSFIVAGDYSATGMISTILTTTAGSAASDMIFKTYSSGLSERMRITSGGVINTTSRLNVNGAGDNSLFSLINNGTTYTLGFSPNASASTSTTLTITTATTTWIYNGSGTATWTLPNPSGTNQMFWIKNAGTGVLTLNAFSGTNIINNSATAVSSITIAVGATALIQQDGNVKSYQLQ